MDHHVRSSLISFAPTVQQQENWAVQKSRLPSDGQITELRIHTYPFDNERGQCFDLDECTVYRSSPQSTPHFIIYSTRKGHSQNAVHSSLTVTQLSPSGALYWPHRNGRRMNTDARARLSDSTLFLVFEKRDSGVRHCVSNPVKERSSYLKVTSRMPRVVNVVGVSVWRN